MGSQCSPAGQCGRELQPFYMESLGHGDAKAMFCKPLGVMKGLMEVSQNCRARHNASDNICLLHKTILNAFDCV